jgi:hypothetical protein
MSKDISTYLNAYMGGTSGFSSEDDPLHSRLLKLLQEIKQERAGVDQWTGIIKGLSQKGVKAAEIADSAVLEYLATHSNTVKVEKAALLGQIARRLPRIKRVELASPSFEGYTNIPAGKYSERLYILSSEAMSADDALEDLQYRIEDLGFNPGPLISDPGIVDRLEFEMKTLRAQRPEMFDFADHHFSSKVKAHGKNLLAHARVTQHNGLFFVEEIQSDWAQQGRRSDWDAGYPQAPLVTVTEQWAGVVLRDLLHSAATDPSCKQFAWINSNMRNGWQRSSENEGDDLATFYATIIRKMAEKTIEKAGGRVLPTTVPTKHGPQTVLGFEMTDSVRDALKLSLPMYSRDELLPRGTRLDLERPEDPVRLKERALIVQNFDRMLGSSHTIRFVNHVYDWSQGIETAGKYFNRGIELSLNAKNLTRASSHEAWHFAEECFLLPDEKRKMRLAFTFGSELSHKTIEALHRLGSSDAAKQCLDPSECAAHAFSLWREGSLSVDDEPQTTFGRVSKALDDIGDWLSEKVFGTKVSSVQDLFTAMNLGVLAQREDMAKEAAEAAMFGGKAKLSEDTETEVSAVPGMVNA